MGEEQFRVIDRRGRDSTEASPEKSSGQAPPTGGNQSEAASSTEQQEGAQPVDFPSFIFGLATQAMMLLGEMPDPNTGNSLPVNLLGARQTIDIIAMLQEKTKGNLSKDEEKLVQDILTSLRLTYVKKAKK